MSHRVHRIAALAMLALAACTDRTPVSPVSAPRLNASEGRGTLQRYVAIGTSVSEGWQSDGISGASQRTSWPRQLAQMASRDITQPYIQAPGCRPPLLLPLGSGVRVDGSPVAPTPTFCAPLETGVTLPTQNLAINASTTLEALTFTPAAVADPARQGLFARTLPAGTTQVTAMMMQNPKFVSVEFGANEILDVTRGFYAPGVNVFPVLYWKPLYRQLLDSVVKVTKQGVLVGLIDDVRHFPSFRTGPELWANRAVFATFNVAVAADCAASPNIVFVPFAVPTAIATGAYYAQHQLGSYPFSCLDQGGTVADFILSPGDVTAINAQLADMDAYIAAEALRIGFAYFRLAALYDRPGVKPAYSLAQQLGTMQPYGSYFSGDGMHPSALGASVLAAAAASAINARYDFSIPVPTIP
jgi:hypothetical protein